ncbi:zinc metalloprotease HtpX [Immundisolibacter sp.]|uniref:zinc metalloprotease HtpX n=1 Tax=Immundisolibacter sp. TaxID=1934948 RepID=UPI0019856A95|nr:zinc metalloprotease HtpX [Immundisolibacter sp.]MBC7161751.1 M48 family metalloprotease [Immundisolibacter sp.]MEA3220819.1 Protease HtpX [Immundisolibacter sp.]
MLSHRARNTLQALALLAGMAALLGLLGGLLGGTVGAVWALGLAGVLLALSPRIAPALLLRLYGGQPIHADQAPGLVRAVQVLAARAGLPQPPALFLVPSPLLNAFTVGTPKGAAVAVTAGLLRGLPMREVVAVLAHEIAHIRNHDMLVMGLADLMSRLTSLLSNVGVLLVLLNLPLVLLGQAVVNWDAVALLLLMPALGMLLQLALSRTREYDADAGAVALTGDPEGLMRALEHLEQRQGRWLEQLLLPGRRLPDPSLLRTHPPTPARIERLKALAQTLQPAAVPDWEPVRQLGPAVLRRPRWRPGGVWY